MEYMKSIFDNESCFFCGSYVWLEKHHVFGGPYRKKSEYYGYTVIICHWDHNEPGGVHFNKEKRDELKRICQAHFEETHTREDFINTFGKSYAED